MKLCIGKLLITATLGSIVLTACASTPSASSSLTAEDKAVELVMGSLTKDEAVDCSLTMTVLRQLQDRGVISSNVESSYFSNSSRAFVTRMTNAIEKDEGLGGLLGVLSQDGEFLKTSYVTAFKNETSVPAKMAMLKTKFASCEPFASEYLGEGDVSIDWSVAGVVT